MAFKEKDRPMEWWREEGEVAPEKKSSRMSEAYADRPNNHFGPGDSGVNPPPVMIKSNVSSGYADEAYGSDGHVIDGLGKGSKGVKAHAKGASGKEIPDVKTERKATRPSQPIFEDDENEMDQDNMDEDFDDGFGGDEDVGSDDGMEQDDDVLGGESDFDGDETSPESIKVEIDGETYSLVKDDEGEGFDDDDQGFPGDDQGFPGDDQGFAGDDQGDEDEFGGDDEEDFREGTFERKSLEDDDEDFNDKKLKDSTKGNRMKKGVNYDRVLENAVKAVKKTEKAKAVRYYLEMKRTAEKKLQELFTGEYVLNVQGEAGLDFSTVGGDREFAVVDRAANGTQYSPTISKSPWEPDKSHKGGKTQHGVVVEKAKKALAYKKWLEAQLAESEAHPRGVPDSYDGKNGDSFAHVDGLDDLLSAQDGGGASEFPAEPEIQGGQLNNVSVPNTQKYKNNLAHDGNVRGSGSLESSAGAESAQKEALRRKAQMSRQQEKSEVNFPSEEVEDDIRSSLNESFSYKDLLAGKY